MPTYSRMCVLYLQSVQRRSGGTAFVVWMASVEYMIPMVVTQKKVWLLFLPDSAAGFRGMVYVLFLLSGWGGAGALLENYVRMGWRSGDQHVLFLIGLDWIGSFCYLGKASVAVMRLRGSPNKKWEAVDFSAWWEREEWANINVDRVT